MQTIAQVGTCVWRVEKKERVSTQERRCHLPQVATGGSSLPTPGSPRIRTLPLCPLSGTAGCTPRRTAVPRTYVGSMRNQGFSRATYWPCMQDVGGWALHLREQPLRLVFADRRSGTQSPANQTLPSSPPADHLCPAHLRLARGGQPHRDPGAAPAQGLLVQGPGEAQLAQVPGLDPAQGVVRFRSDVSKTLFTM